MMLPGRQHSLYYTAGDPHFAGRMDLSQLKTTDPYSELKLYMGRLYHLTVIQTHTYTFY